MLGDHSKSSAKHRDQDNFNGRNSAGSVAYSLFLYREELRRRDVRILNLSKTKLNLTQELVLNSVERIAEYNTDELRNLNREIMFTRKLKNRMHIIRRIQKLQGLRQNVLIKV